MNPQKLMVIGPVCLLEEEVKDIGAATVPGINTVCIAFLRGIFGEINAVECEPCAEGDFSLENHAHESKLWF